MTSSSDTTGSRSCRRRTLQGPNLYSCRRATGTLLATGSITHGFPGDIEARLQKLQEIAQRHEDRLDGLDNLIRSETEERRHEAESLQSALRAIERGLQEKINEVAANGLTLESWGVWPFSGSGLC
jgi:hypothetical protein